MKKPEVKRRKIAFAERISTRIWQEEPASHNPYLAEHCRCHGYDLLELMAHCRFSEVLFLLLKGELPSEDELQLLEALMVALINPGPRHPATRAAMNAGVGKTYPQHILPIALSILGGEHLGGSEVERSMRFLAKHLGKDPEGVLEDTLKKAVRPKEGDWHIVPGFGSRFGGIDPMPQKIARHLVDLPGGGRALAWGDALAKALHPHDMGWLTTGVAAAAFVDLGFLPRMGSGLFQIICAPGLLAHGLEMAPRPITAMPFLDDERYVIEED